MNEILNRTVEIKNSSVTVFEIPFKEPVHLPFAELETRPSVWVEVDMDVEGVEARGAAEGASLPIQIPLYDDYSGNLQNNSQAILAEIAGKKIELFAMLRQIKGMELGGNFATARMAVETALIDCVSRAEGRTVASYLDGKPSRARRLIPYGKSIGEKDRDKILSAAHQAVINGARRLKFKLSPDNYLQLYPALQEVMETYPGVECMVDANGMFDVENKDHLEMLRNVDNLHLLTIEEPVSRAGNVRGLMAHRVLSSTMRLETPVTIDDAVKTAHDAEIALNENLAQIVNLKPGRVGSFIESVRIADYAKSRGSEIMVGGMFEATPGRMMTLTLASYCLSQGFKIPGDVSLPQERLADDIGESVLSLDEQNNVVFAPCNGWGYQV